MAGPLLVFGFMVLPPLAARPFARGIASFFTLSSLIGLFTAIFGFYLSIILDLPLGPTDVALACALLFLSHALKRLLSSALNGVHHGVHCLPVSQRLQFTAKS